MLMVLRLLYDMMIAIVYFIGKDDISCSFVFKLLCIYQHFLCAGLSVYIILW